MSIVSSIVFQDHAESDGRRYIQYQHTDHLGAKHHSGMRLVPAAFSLDATADGVLTEASLDEGEAQGAIDRVESGEDALVVANSFIHSTQKNIAKALIRHMVATRDVYFALAMESLVDFIRATFTNPQIEGFLDITNAQLITLNNKYNAVINAKTDLETADVQEDFGG